MPMFENIELIGSVNSKAKNTIFFHIFYSQQYFLDMFPELFHIVC